VSAVTTVAPAGSAPTRSGAVGASRLPSLTGLRFVAAFLVFGFHVHIEHVIAGGPVRMVMEWVFGPGAVGVSFFFILSGFVLTWSVRPDDTAVRFWRRRVAKIYPNHLVTAVAAIGAAAVTGAGLGVAVVVPNLLLVQAWTPDRRIFFGLNTVSWSLACEVFFYALFPLIHRVLVRVSGRALWPAAAATLALIWLVPVAAQLLPTADRYWAVWVFPLARLPEFVAGMVLARIVREGRWPAVPLWSVVALTVAVYLSSRWLPGDFRLVACTAVPLALLVSAFGATDAAGRRTPLAGRLAVWLGTLSFAFYLVHQLVLRLVVKVAGAGHAAPAGIALALAALVVAIGGSWLLFRCVEQPGMRLIGGSRRNAAVRRRAAGTGEERAHRQEYVGGS
jgi:peptidoglycan/LPS O-acetylase OafA/YrhL